MATEKKTVKVIGAGFGRTGTFIFHWFSTGTNLSTCLCLLIPSSLTLTISRACLRTSSIGFQQALTCQPVFVC